MTCQPSTLMGWRAVICLLLTLALTTFFHLGHAWWAPLTSLALITQSFGDGLFRAFKRFLLTILGCALGYVFLVVFHHQETATFTLLVVSFFGLSYFFTTGYGMAMFFLGICVAMLFELMSGWTLALLWERTYETLIGAAVSIGVAALFWPEFADKKFYERLAPFLHDVSEFMSIVLNGAGHAERRQEILQSLARDMHRFRELYQFMRYESWLRPRMPLEKNQEVLRRLASIFHYVSSLNDALFHLGKCQEHLPSYTLALTAGQYYVKRLTEEVSALKALL